MYSKALTIWDCTAAAYGRALGVAWQDEDAYQVAGAALSRGEQLSG